MPGRSIALVAAIAALSVATAAFAANQNGIVRPAVEPAQPSVKLGESLFNANCASCHGIGGGGIERPRPGAGGVTGAGPSLRGVGAQAADFYLRTGFMPLANIHAEPSNQRVPFTHKEIVSLTEFVASLGKGPAVPRPRPGQGSLAEGFALFTEDCAGCHQSLGRGG
ncbi:MAG TPA: c-type cytochrome, partial [Solirubrobacteraceae bacterium]|nr:c-type cytochrome [Solirubrobacteraceae bacterium]